MPVDSVNFCERYFGIFLFVWGICLEVDALADIPSGMFLRRFESFMPGWAWGLVMIGLAAARYLAHRFGRADWRLSLSALTVALMAVIAMIAVYARLWGATAPLSIFVAAIAWWCHGNLAREIYFREHQ